MIEDISVTSLLTEFLFYSDYPLPASSDHLGFWCLSCHYLVRQELGTLHLECLWTRSSARSPHYNIRLQRLCPQGHNVLPTESLSGQAVLRDRNGHVEGSFWSRSWGMAISRITAEVSYLPGYILSSTILVCLPPPSLSRCPEHPPAARGTEPLLCSALPACASEWGNWFC